MVLSPGLSYAKGLLWLIETQKSDSCRFERVTNDNAKKGAVSLKWASAAARDLFEHNLRDVCDNDFRLTAIQSNLSRHRYRFALILLWI